MGVSDGWSEVKGMTKKLQMPTVHKSMRLICGAALACKHMAENGLKHTNLADT